jgi:hypothetical protein
MSTTSDYEAPSALRSASDRLERLQRDLEEAAIDESDLETVADAYEAVERTLDRWEARATDWDDFEGYVEFRNDLAETLESIPEDIPASDAFVEADGHVKTSGVSKSLTASDFEAAREALAPAREYAERREALREARERYRSAYRAARRRRQELTERVDELERLLELGEADLAAPVEELRGPIEHYDDAVTEAFADFRRNSPARELLALVDTGADYPLVGYRTPPAELLSYVREQPAGRHSVSELLEYAEYSLSKLRHYVDDADLLKRRIATNRTYLEGLSAEPLCIGWPPSDGETLWFETGELISVVSRFADDETVTALRSVRELASREDYERLRTAAVARAELTPGERERLESGAVAAELEDVREEYRRLEEAIDACER